MNEVEKTDTEIFSGVAAHSDPEPGNLQSIVIALNEISDTLTRISTQLEKLTTEAATPSLPAPPAPVKKAKKDKKVKGKKR